MPELIAQINMPTFLPHKMPPTLNIPEVKNPFQFDDETTFERILTVYIAVNSGDKKS